jgi:hypothetical protein
VCACKGKGRERKGKRIITPFFSSRIRNCCWINHETTEKNHATKEAISFSTHKPPISKRIYCHLFVNGAWVLPPQGGVIHATDNLHTVQHTVEVDSGHANLAHIFLLRNFCSIPSVEFIKDEDDVVFSQVPFGQLLPHPNPPQSVHSELLALVYIIYSVLYLHSYSLLSVEYLWNKVKVC